MLKYNAAAHNFSALCCTKHSSSFNTAEICPGLFCSRVNVTSTLLSVRYHPTYSTSNPIYLCHFLFLHAITHRPKPRSSVTIVCARRLKARVYSFPPSLTPIACPRPTLARCQPTCSSQHPVFATMEQHSALGLAPSC